MISFVCWEIHLIFSLDTEGHHIFQLFSVPNKWYAIEVFIFMGFFCIPTMKCEYDLKEIQILPMCTENT